MTESPGLLPGFGGNQILVTVRATLLFDVTRQAASVFSRGAGLSVEFGMEFSLVFPTLNGDAINVDLARNGLRGIAVDEQFDRAELSLLSTGRVKTPITAR